MTKFSDVLAAGVTIRESANDGSDFSNPSADYRRLFLGEDGLLHVKDSAGAVTSPYSSSAPTRHWCRAVRTTSQTISDGTLTAIAFNAADVADTDAYHDTSSNNTKIIIPTGLGGLYLIQASVPWQVSGTGARLAAFRLNGTTTIGIIHDDAYTAGIDAANHVSGSTMYALAQTDYVEVVVFQNSGGNRDVIAADAGPYLSATLIAA